MQDQELLDFLNMPQVIRGLGEYHQILIDNLRELKGYREFTKERSGTESWFGVALKFKGQEREALEALQEIKEACDRGDYAYISEVIEKQESKLKELDIKQTIERLSK